MINLYSSIFRYLESKYPEEGCGIIINKQGELVWIPCDNIAEDKFNNFTISGLDYVKASMIGDIYSIVHSHPDVEPNPSEVDIKAANFLKVKYTIVSIPTLIVNTFTPSYKIKPYVGRTYIEKEDDCWSLVLDYYRNELGITLPICDHYTDNWRDEGIPFYSEEYIKGLGFEKVTSPEVGDLILFNVMSNNPNHFGIYIGGNLFLHHADNRLSCREPIAGVWQKYLKGFLRCKKYI